MAAGQRGGLDADLSSEGLSSLGESSIAILENLERPVEVAIFLSENTPEIMAQKKQEILDKSEAIRRAAGDQVQVKVFRSQSLHDKVWTKAIDQYGLVPRAAIGEGASGPREIQILFGAAVSGGPETQLVPFFDPGVSVEYQLLRAIDTLQKDLAESRPVMGILRTELQMNGSFDFQTGNSRPPLTIVEEWQRQFEIRDVEPDQPISEDIDVLVAAVPSSLQRGSSAISMTGFGTVSQPCFSLMLCRW